MYYNRKFDDELLESFKREKVRKEILHIILEDEEMIKCIKDFFFKDNKNSDEEKSRIDFMRNKIEFEKKNLLEEIGKLKDENKSLKEMTEELKGEILNLKNEKFRIEKEIRDQIETINKMKNRFAAAEEAYELYNSIDGSLKEELNGIFKRKSLEDFIYCGVQGKNMDSLWEITKKSVLSDNRNWEKAVRLFDYFFDAFNRTYDIPLYSYLEVTEGEQFNPELHISKGMASGRIKSLCLKGYKDRSGKVIKKSIVYL